MISSFLTSAAGLQLYAEQKFLDRVTTATASSMYGLKSTGEPDNSWTGQTGSSFLHVSTALHHTHELLVCRQVVYSLYTM